MSKSKKANHGGPSGRCEACGKFAFSSRSAAKRYMIKRFPGDKLTVYKCPETEWYHFGHTPYSVKRGFRERGEGSVYRKPWLGSETDVRVDE